MVGRCGRTHPTAKGCACERTVEGRVLHRVDTARERVEFERDAPDSGQRRQREDKLSGRVERAGPAGRWNGTAKIYDDRPSDDADPTQVRARRKPGRQPVLVFELVRLAKESARHGRGCW